MRHGWLKGDHMIFLQVSRIKNGENFLLGLMLPIYHKNQ